MPQHGGGHRAQRRALQEVEPPVAEPPPAKHLRTRTFLRQGPSEQSRDLGSQRSGPEGASEQSRDLGSQGSGETMFRGEPHKSAAEFRSFVSRLYLRTYWKGFVRIPTHPRLQPTPHFASESLGLSCWDLAAPKAPMGLPWIRISRGTMSVASRLNNWLRRRPRLGLLESRGWPRLANLASTEAIFPET